MSKAITIYPSVDAIAEAIAQMLIAETEKPTEELFHIALSGGNTPKAIFLFLQKNYGTKLACRRFHFWWGDERCVAPTNDESNYKWAYELWLKPIGVLPEQIHRIRGENLPETEALRYEEELREFAASDNQLPVIHLNMLGLGEDGHTASIFPHCAHLLNSKKWCEVATHPISGQKRITMTGPVLNHSEKVVFISVGETKAEIIKKVAIEAAPQYPASHIQPPNGEVLWMIDSGAAKYVRGI